MLFWQVLNEVLFCATNNRTPGLSVGSSRKPVPWRNERCPIPGGLHCLGQQRQTCSPRCSQCKLQNLLLRAHCKLHRLHLQASSPAGMVSTTTSRRVTTTHLWTAPHASSSTSTTAAHPRNTRTSQSPSLSKCKRHRRRLQLRRRQSSSARILIITSVDSWSILLPMSMAVASVAGVRTPRPPGSLAMASALTAVTGGKLQGESTSLLIWVQILQRSGDATYPGSPS